MVHTACDGLSQDGDRSIDFFRRPPYQLVSSPGRQLHRTIAHAIHGQGRRGNAKLPPGIVCPFTLSAPLYDLVIRLASCAAAAMVSIRHSRADAGTSALADSSCNQFSADA